MEQRKQLLSQLEKFIIFTTDLLRVSRVHAKKMLTPDKC